SSLVARTGVSRRYVGRASKPVPWDVLSTLFDAVWGPEARSLPKYPQVIGGKHANWTDAAGNRHDAESLDEVREAYEKYATGSIKIGRLFGADSGARTEFRYWPRVATVTFEVEAADQTTADRLVEEVKKRFPLEARYIFVSYDTSEVEL